MSTPPQYPGGVGVRSAIRRRRRPPAPAPRPGRREAAPDAAVRRARSAWLPPARDSTPSRSRCRAQAGQRVPRTVAGAKVGQRPIVTLLHPAPLAFFLVMMLYVLENGLVLSLYIQGVSSTSMPHKNTPRGKTARLLSESPASARCARSSVVARSRGSTWVRALYCACAAARSACTCASDACACRRAWASPPCAAACEVATAAPTAAGAAPFGVASGTTTAATNLARRDPRLRDIHRVRDRLPGGREWGHEQHRPAGSDTLRAGRERGPGGVDPRSVLRQRQREVAGDRNRLRDRLRARSAPAASTNDTVVVCRVTFAMSYETLSTPERFLGLDRLRASGVVD